jgi:hypothetical protein
VIVDTMLRIKSSLNVNNKADSPVILPSIKINPRRPDKKDVAIAMWIGNASVLQKTQIA